MRLTPTQAGKLLKLEKGLTLSKSELPKDLYRSLCDAGVIRVEKSGSGHLIRGIPGKLEAHAKREWGINNLVEFSQATPEDRSRELLADIAGDSKALPSRPLAGIFLRTFGNASLSKEPLQKNPAGSAVFIKLPLLPELQIYSRSLIAVENPACFFRFEDCIRHFPELAGKDFMLVLRWSWNSAWREWFRQWEGDMLYFPDYDPAGLRIFLSEVLPFQPTARLLIPDNFEQLLKERGNRKLYIGQEHLMMEDLHHESVAWIAKHLSHYRRGLEQEALCH